MGLKELGGLTELTALDVYGTKATLAGVAALRKAFVDPAGIGDTAA